MKDNFSDVVLKFKMAATSDQKDENNQILYDLLVQAEWQLEAEPLSKAEEEFWKEKGPLHWKFWRLSQITLDYLLQTVRSSIRLTTSFGCPPVNFTKVLSNNLPWNISLASNGTLLAVLTDEVIEVRSYKDSFCSVVAKCQVGTDPFPQWRRITWSKHGSLLALASSFGEISVFDTSCSLLYKIKKPGASMNLPTGFNNCLCALFFIDADKSSDWEFHLICVTYHGVLHRYLLNNTSYKEAHTFSFSRYHPAGVAAVVYSLKHNMLVVAGFEGDEPSLEESEFTGARAGITLWRELSDSPHYAIVNTDSKSHEKMSKRSRLKGFPWKAKDVNNHGIYKCVLSPNEDTIVTLHQNGRITNWRMPSLKLQKTWSLSEQPSSNIERNSFLLDEKSHIDGDAATLENFVNINWWSEEALICARGSGSIAVSSTEDLENLLGQSEEMFEPWPCTTDASNGQFLVLECEKKIKKVGETSILKDAYSEENDHDDVETFMTKISKMCKQTLYFLTENDNFKPPSKQIRFMQRTYRLVALQSTTPEELYARKIDLEEYGEALELAKRFRLDTDLVYQRQWTTSPITVISIKDYLSKINNRFWVLNECVKRVPEDIDAMKYLLKYGLLGTNAKIIKSIETQASLPFAYFEEQQEANDDDEQQGSKETDELCDVVSSLKLESLSEKQSQLCRYRWQLLQYLDRLETYEIILGGPFKAAERYRPDFFLQFRCCNIIDQAIEYARTSYSEPLEELFTYHGGDVLPHWLAILSNFPETTPVSSYQRLLPSVRESDSGEIVIEEWKKLKHRELDWVEADIIKRHVIEQDNEEDQSAFIYEDQPYLRTYRSCNDANLLTKWFIERAHEIESRASLVDNALSLIEHGIESGIQGLEETRDNLKWLSVLAYEVNVEPAIGLAQFEKLTDLEKLRLLMSKSTEETFVQDYQKWASRFMVFVGKTNLESQWKLLKRYLTDVAKSDLAFALKIFEKSVPGCDEPLIADVAKLMILAIDCIYICKRDDQLDLAFKIVECLPSRDDSHLSAQIDDLHDKVDHLEHYLRGSEILKLYSTPKPVSFLVNTEGDSNTARDIFTTLCRNASKKEPALQPKDWNLFLKHIQQLREEVYDCVTIKEVYKILVSHILCSGIENNLSLAKELLTVTRQKRKVDSHHASTSKPKKMPRLTNSSFVLPYDDSVSLVLDAAKEYFNSGANLIDPILDLSRKSLNIIEDSPPLVQYELDLIAALGILHDFGVNILPVQVRLCEDKLDLIRRIATSGSASYRKTAKIHKLAKLLHISSGEEKERLGKVTTILAEAALECEDLSFAKDMCLSLVDLSYAPGWNVCRTLCESDKFTDLETKQRMVGFSLTFCSPDQIEPLLLTRHFIEMQAISEVLDKQDFFSGEGEEREAEQTLDSTDGQASSSLLNRTQKKLTSKTKAIFSNVSDASWWKSQVQWVSDFDRSIAKSTVQSTGKEEKQIKPVCHPFYAPRMDTVVGDFKQSLQGIFDLDAKDQMLLLNALCFRRQKLAESRTEGAVSEPSKEVVLQLADSELYHETLMFLAFLFSLDKVMDGQELFSKYEDDPLALQLIVYALAVELESQKNPHTSAAPADLYSKFPLAVIWAAAEQLEEVTAVDSGTTCNALKKYLFILSDFVQARTLDGLGKGVDVQRFMKDNEYKRETVLGLAMSLEDKHLSISLSLAEKYDLPSWEVLCAHTEFLFTDSGLKVKEVQDRLNKLDVIKAFSDNGAEVLERMKIYVYPYINGTDHALLLILFHLIQQCCGDDAKIEALDDFQKKLDLEGSISVGSHVRALKKLKSAAPRLDYKDLIDGSSPLEALKEVMMESNVHVLAKLVPKITGLDGSMKVSSEDIFSTYILKVFWEGSKKQEDGEVQWLHRFESVQKHFVKISATHVIAFAKDVALSERAVDTIPREIRLNILKRILKYVRQQKVQEEKQAESSGPTSLTFSDSEMQLEMSYNHLQSLDREIFLRWLKSDDEKERGYVRRLEISGSDPLQLATLARDLFLDMRRPEEVNEIFMRSSNQGRSKSFVAEAFREALKSVIATLISPQDIHRSTFSGMIDLVSDHLESDGNLLSQEDVLKVVRPLCTNFDVRTDLKMELLQILEKSFELHDDDIFLLIYYQTDAIIAKTWGKSINPEDIDSDEKRCDLFHSLIKDSDDNGKLESLGMVLIAWPVLSVVENNQDNPAGHPWMVLFMKLIGNRGIEKFLELFRLALHKVKFGLKCFMELHEKLVSAGFEIEALKMALLSQNEICIKEGFKVFENTDVHKSFEDIDLFQAVLETKTVGEIAKTSLFSPFINYILSKPSNEVVFNNVVSQLKSAGLEVEAGTLIMRHSKLHRALSTIDIAVSSFVNWFQR